MSVRIKICGVTRTAHVRTAVAAGADAVGLVFVRSSPRALSVQQGALLAREIAPYVTAVGLFVDPERSEVEAILERVQLQCLQFQGAEDDAFCASFGLPYIKAIRAAAAIDGDAAAACFPHAQGIQIDSAVSGAEGGTGSTFDWAWFPRGTAKPWILAGGLDVTNVGAAVRELRPYAVDVSSGVESTRGVKDEARIAAFCAAVRAADR